MNRSRGIFLARLAIVMAAIALLEALCRGGVIRSLTMIPPSAMLVALVRMLGTSAIDTDITFTVLNIFGAALASIVIGFCLGALLHGMSRVRSMLEPLFAAYYAVPTFAFYPLLIVLFGIGRTSLIVMGALFGVVAMMVNTLTGLDRVPRVQLKTAVILRLGFLRTFWFIRLPSASLHLMTGVKLAVAFSVIGVVAGEFILATDGIGKRIAIAYNEFDNGTMYGLLLFLLTFVLLLNGVLQSCERRLQRRLRRQ